MLSKQMEMEVFLRKYIGSSGPFILHKQCMKLHITDLETADDQALMNLTDNIMNYVLDPMLSRGRLALARSELMGILGLGVSVAEIPMEIDGIKVMPDSIKDEAREKFKSMMEYILDKEKKKYKIEGFDGVDSKTRIKIVKAFVEQQFGSSGKVLVENKLDELGIEDLDKAFPYKKLLLLEYIIQDLLMYYVEPLKARMLRSELVTIIGIELELVQGSTPEVVKAEEEVKKDKIDSKKSVRMRKAFEDMFEYLSKKEMSKRKISNLKGMEAAQRNDITKSILTNLLGGMTDFVFSRMLTDDPAIVEKFMLSYTKNYLTNMMKPEEAEKIHTRITNTLDLPLN